MTREKMKKLKKGDIVYVACKVDAVFIYGGFVQVSTRDCDRGFDAYEDEVLEPCEDCISRQAMLQYQQYLHGKMPNEENHKLWEFIKDLPPVTPTQESVLDKIRAEINALSNANPSYWHSGDMVEREDVLEIIDKYKGVGK